MTVYIPETPPTPSRKMPPALRIAAFIFSVLILISVSLPILAFSALFARGPLPQDTTIVIARGSNAAEIGTQLAHEDAIYLPLLFRLAARLTGHLKAGEYALPAHATPLELALMMHEGRSIVRMFTVAEGLTSFEVVQLLNDDPALTGKITAPPPEGSLLPETYRYSYGDSRAEIIARMQRAMQDKLNELWASREQGLPLKSPEEAVVLASIVEKETGKPEERPRIAGVFFNRLRLNMRLQSDPTVIYALTKGGETLDRPLTHDDLLFSSPINTYTSDGLPPQPICNPGRAALEAVMHPEHNGFLYFVADGKGGHAFANDLATQDKNIKTWLHIENSAARK